MVQLTNCLEISKKFIFLDTHKISIQYKCKKKESLAVQIDRFKQLCKNNLIKVVVILSISSKEDMFNINIDSHYNQNS
ncbi:unnamed protein product (macronuclear) [Paramecium tetraurelia]|uniref:Uncharacterized protein n=1 Tax=Paramecium tetraurelia TaxID=5888 RepID=A0D143_PARTE|nr:uncharacterized protein GSPATT00039175001 [Paramecium tetraurelia]CAK76760.1 unnamed protein product [Paramecium tetraurelia]|eukprot:XP_001444157.1 hypothetical protein (macronuclear) [Paramecium tetraurelia strain d4-2]